ncbi:MAG: branched-chain amino acid ABC transporter permease, partial [Rhodospirillaceae bacterium]
FTLMFGVLKVLNLTYGFYFTAGALVALAACRDLGASLWLALPLGMLAAAGLAVAIDTALLTPLRRARAPELASLMVTLGAVLLLYSLLSMGLGTEIRRFPFGVLPSAAVELGGVRLGAAQLLIVVTTAALVAGLWLLLGRTRLGLALRAVAENEDAARLMGIDVPKTIMLASLLSGLLAGAAGVLIGLNQNAIQPYMGETMMLRGFAVIIIGGLGDVRGAVAAGLLLGVAEVMAAGYIDSMVKDGVAFTLMVLVLWLKPAGLLGRARVTRA